MHPVQLSPVVGRKGSGVSTLLKAFRQRPDARDVLIGPDEAIVDMSDPTAITAWLRAHRESARRIVLPSTDLRAPRHLLQALAEDADLAKAFRLDAISAAIDARTPPDQIEAAGPSGRFFASVDRIVLTHTDRVRPDAVTKLAKALKALNPPAPILRARHGDIGPARLVDGGLFDPVDGSIDIDRWLCEAAFGFETARRRAASGPDLPETALSRLRNDAAVRFFAVTMDQPLDSAVLSVFMKLLMADRGADLLRLKGIVATRDHPARPALIDAREHLLQPLLWLETWPTADRRSRLVFTTADTSEDWIRTLLTTLSDQLELQAMPELQMAMVREVG